MFKIASIFIPVTDLEQSADWYKTVLGAKKIGSWETGIGMYLESGTTQLTLIKTDSSQTTEFQTQVPQRNVYYNFVVENIEAAHQHFVHHNVSVTAIENFNGIKSFNFFDLENHLFSVVDEDADSPFYSGRITDLQKKRSDLF